jgi:catechol 2,3-dioxygenase-like lactoylglutathione lyase family enzyme
MRVVFLDHLVLTVRNIERTCEWYNRVLGMDIISFGDGRTALQFGEQKINLQQTGYLIQPHANMPTPGSGDLCFITMTAMDDVIEHLNNNDVPIIEGPIERTGAMGQIISVYVRDPDNNLLEISNYP